MKRKIFLLFALFICYCIFGYQRSKYRQPIIIYSENITHIVDRLMGFEAGVVKGVALPPPFLILKKKGYPMEESWIRHEQTHHMQMSESLFLFPLFSHIEKVYMKYVKGKSNMEAYLWKATEQEAYLHQHNPIYNQERKIRSTLHHIINKQQFRLDQSQLICHE